MTTDRDMEPIIRDWTEQPTTLRRDGLQRALAQVEVTTQDHPGRWWPFRQESVSSLGLPTRRYQPTPIPATNGHSPAPGRRFQSMFSATKFVVAGVIVALFGGFLVTNVLTQQGEDQLPAPGASLPASAEVRSDLLLGVDLVTDEVSPGVFRVFSDGKHDLSTNVWRVAVSPDGDVWVKKHRLVVNQKRRVTSKDNRVLRLGEVGSYLRGASSDEYGLDLTTLDDGTVSVWRGRMNASFRFDGRRWTRYDDPGSCRGLRTADGACWVGKRTPNELERIDVDGARQVFTPEGIGLGPDLGFGGIRAFADDGSLWTEVFDVDGLVGLAVFDGDEWTKIEHESLRGGVHDLAVGPDGELWVASFGGRGRVELMSWDGSTWTSYGPVGYTGGFHLLPDGTVLLGSLAVVDGSSLRQVEIPASPTNREPELTSVAQAPDGSVWVTVSDPRGGARCPEAARQVDDCSGSRVGATDGLYVITPEALVATE